MTSAERGDNVTMLPFVNAAAKLFPGVFVFPRKKVSDKMKNMPEGFILLAHPSGWMTEGNFLIALKHLHSQVKCRKEKPIILFLDNHISHMGYSICVFAKENGIILQTLPPHTSHASQPLDRTIYGPFKCHLAESHAYWMREPDNECQFMKSHFFPNQRFCEHLQRLTSRKGFRLQVYSL